MVADALSRLPPNCFTDEGELQNLSDTTSINAVLQIESDRLLLEKIKAGYLTDEFCVRVAATLHEGMETI